MALGFGDVPLEIVIRASNQLAPGLAAAGAQLKAFQAEVGRASGQLSLPGIGGGGAAGFGLLGALGPTLAIGGGVAVIGAAVTAEKSLVDTYRAEQTALSDLRQAYQSVGLPAGDYMQLVQDYIDKHHTYIADLDAVREGVAKLTRAGIDQSLVLKAVDAANNISILQGKDFGDVLTKLLLGFEGNSRGLKELGINTKDYGDLTRSASQIAKDDAAAKKKVEEASVNLSKAQRTLAEDQQRLHDKGYATANDLMHEEDLKGKVKDATNKLHDAQGNYNTVVQAGNSQLNNQNALLDTYTKKGQGAEAVPDALTKAQHNLNYEWERLSNEVGPGAITSLATIEGHMADIVGDVVDKNLAKGVHDFSDALGGLPLGPLAQVAQLWGVIADKMSQANQSAAGPITGGGHGGVGGPHPSGSGGPVTGSGGGRAPGPHGL